ncbi:acyl-CoA dehydrogenase family protein [bacterium]|nr:acyl-CoA dehydrogenase family protein [bacterium]
MKRKIFGGEHETARKAFREYIKKELVPYYADWEVAGMVPREVWQKAGQQGWLCPTTSKVFGGEAVDFLYSVVFTEELYYHALQGVFWTVHSDIVMPYIEKLATEDKKKQWIPRCVQGDAILAIAMTEPEAGSDLARLSTRADRDGDDYIVNGVKTFISNGQLADLVVVAVRTSEKENPRDGISLLVVESDSRGYQKGRNLDKIGLHAQDTSEIFFDNCRVPVSNLLGREGEGFRYLMENLQQERLILSIGAYAAAMGALDVTLEYVKKRRAFGKTIGEFQNTRFVLAELATKIQLARSFLDDLIPRHMAGEDLVREVSMAKYWITDLQFEVADRCLQFFGGYGYMKAYPISRFFVDARVQRIYGGANELMKELIARRLNI